VNAQIAAGKMTSAEAAQTLANLRTELNIQVTVPLVKSE
jgi:hypothetical protein